ncbi:MAG: OsmC family protein [Thiothrix litoralis]
MKLKPFLLTTAACLAVLSSAAIAEDASTAAPIDHKIVTRIDSSPAASALGPVAATPRDGAFTQNVVTAGARIFAPDNAMLKTVTVQPVDVEGYSAWALGSDEGGADHLQTAPNPLSYLSAGIAANLYTSLQQAVEVMGLAVDDMKVEVKVDFSWKKPFAPDWAGFTDLVTANIIIESKEAPERLAELKQMALEGWIAGAGLAKAMPVDAALVVNGTHWDTLAGAPGLIPDPVSRDNGLTLSQKTGTPQLDTIDPGKDFGMGGPMALGAEMPDSIAFSVVAVVDSAKDADRPYLHRINVRAMQDNYVGWELYADDSFGNEGLAKAPSSLDYLSAGTTHCLMSQMAITPMALKLDIPDFRAEHQFSYRQDGYMTADMKGFVDGIEARVVVNSDESMEALEAYYNLSLRLCFAGEAWTGETAISSGLYVNGTLVK